MTDPESTVKQAMILAAGRGERLRPITDHTPKPLVKVRGESLLQHHLNALHAAQFKRAVINVCHLKQQIIDYVSRHPVAEFDTVISDEGDSALETGGGMFKALPLLNHQPFLAVNGDVLTDLDYSQVTPLAEGMLAHLVLVSNPEHNPKGDFTQKNNLLCEMDPKSPSYTYSGIGWFHPDLFQQGIDLGQKFSVVPLIKAAIQKQAVSCQIHTGEWNDVGTPERLAQLNGGTICA